MTSGDVTQMTAPSLMLSQWKYGLRGGVSLQDTAAVGAFVDSCSWWLSREHQRRLQVEVDAGEIAAAAAFFPDWGRGITGGYSVL